MRFRFPKKAIYTSWLAFGNFHNVGFIFDFLYKFFG